jgi:hypothetical protein
MKLIPDDLIKKHLILPMVQGRRQAAADHPRSDGPGLLDMLRFRLNGGHRAAAGRRKAQIKKFIEGFGGRAPKDAAVAPGNQSLVTESIDKSVDRSVGRQVDGQVDRRVAEDAPIVKLCNRILSEAVKMRASDVHIEPMADRVRLRYRIDGVCIERDNLPKRMQNAMLSRFKLMAGMNIAEKRVPQDGRIKLKVDDVFIDFRVSACPAYHGESVVCVFCGPTACASVWSTWASSRTPRNLQQDHPPAQRHLPGHRPDRFGQDDHAVLGAGHAQPPRQEDHHRRGPGRIQLRGHQPVPGARHIGLTFPAILARCCVRRRTSSWWVKSATRKSPRSPSRPRSRATWCSARCTPTTRPARSRD